MGVINQASNLIDRVVRLERKVNEIWKKIGLTAATISKGGLTLLQDAFFRVVDDQGAEIVYFGPDSQGRQIIRLRREGGSDVMWTGFTANGHQFWRLTDRFINRELFSDDTENGGIARPWLSVPLVPLFAMPGGVYPYWYLPVTGDTSLWEGRIPLVSHPMIVVFGVWGQASGSNSSTYRLVVDGTEVGRWSATTLQNGPRGPFPIHHLLDRTDVLVELYASGSGTGDIACHITSCYMRQT